MLSADGCVEVGEETCNVISCMPPLCGNDLCCTFVAFMNLLPSGPIWDRWKTEAISYFESNDDPTACPIVTDPQCPSLILHSIYTVLKLKNLVHNSLWPALRESNPYTAVTTLDDHLARLNWEDCHRQHCRSVLLGELTPYEVWSSCGPVFCAPEFPAELECAVKRNVAIALTRANTGVIKNLCGINWIVEPLGAEIKPIIPEGEIPPVPDEECASLCMPDIMFEVCYTRDWIEGCLVGDVCNTREIPPQIQAYWDWGCDRPAGTVERIWPAVLAAECIIRSLMPPICPTNIKRCC